MQGVALSDKITIVSFIEDGVAQEVKRQVDIKATVMTTEGDLQLRLNCQFSTTPSMWLHVQYVLSRCNMLNGPLLKVQ